MKRPPAAPRRTPGRCALCGAPLGKPGAAQMALVYPEGERTRSAFAPVCSEQEDCRARRRLAGRP